MALTNRQRGDYFERQARDALTAWGWLVVRAGGSLGVADLVALKLGHTPLLISCKLSGRIDPAEREQFHDAARAAGARAIVASRPKPGWLALAAVTPWGLKPLTPLDDSPLRMPPRRKAPT